MRYTRVQGCKLAIGLVGAARHGKDTAAKALLKALPGAERFAFSDYVSTVARVHHGMVDRDAAVLQAVGTDYRIATPMVWLDALYGQLRDREPEIVVVTGIRYPEELDLVRSVGAETCIVRVVRLHQDGTPFVAADRDMTHPVEQLVASLPVDATIEATEGDTAAIGRRVAAWILERHGSVLRA